MPISYLCVPVTALHACRVADRHVLLSGQGSVLGGYDVETRQIILQQRVFESEVIHGISTASNSDGNESGTLIFLWAGKAAALLRLNLIEAQSGCTVLQSTELCVIDLCDWALYGNFLSPGRQALERAYIVTAHNEVYMISPYRHSNADSSTTTCVKLASGPRCVLYSAYARSTLTEILVAAGTVFGEVVVWSANKNNTSDSWSSRILNVLLGHKGSIFGVCISEEILFAGEYRRLLATCSDDRSIRLWIINDEAQSSVATKNDPPSMQLSDVTGFGDVESSSGFLLAMAWGHSSRIWGIGFLSTKCSGESDNLYLVSTGEDATLRLWHLSLNNTAHGEESNQISLREIGSRSNHSGKNVWSSDSCCMDGKYIQYTGAADGSIVSSKLRNSTDVEFNRGNSHAQTTFNDVFNEIHANSQNHTTGTKPAALSLRHYAIADRNTIMATTAFGDLVQGKIGIEDGQVAWHKIYTTPSKSSLLLCSDRTSRLTFFATAGGHLSALQDGSDSIISSTITIPPQATLMYVASTERDEITRRKQSCLLVSLPSQQGSISLMRVLIAESIVLENITHLKLPVNFVPTSGCYHVQKSVLILGSRSGSIVLYDHLQDLGMPVAVFPNLHEADTVTSIMFLSYGESSTQKPVQDLPILTTGRDGTYAVHRLVPKTTEDRAWELSTVHRSCPPLGPNIEGAYLANNPSSHAQELVIYGFKSTDFVVWNETTQTEVLAVDCGGAHRNWAYCPLEDGFSRAPTHCGVFVWTKAGACNIYRNMEENLREIQLGGHGREIKALAVSPLRLDRDHSNTCSATLVATGAEDTTIRLFAVEAHEASADSPASNKKMICLRILKKHMTGIHHLQFSPCGNYLFSSGGYEELFVWRLHDNTPIIGLGVVLECMLPKTEIDTDARITCFQVHRQVKTHSRYADALDVEFEVAATYSHGKVKIWRYTCETSSRKGCFEQLGEIVEGTFCLTQLHYDAKHEILLTAGTNGFISVHFPWQWNMTWKQKVHQNSIQASVLIKIPYFSSTWLVVTGGDDNALGLTIFCPDSAFSGRSASAFGTLLIPSAHAAAVTGLTLLSQSETAEGNHLITFATVSNDQRVKIWRVTIHAQDVSGADTEMQNIWVEKIAELWISVADAAAIELLNARPDHDPRLLNSAQTEERRVLVVGVGMEILKAPLQH
jgi:WD40 repeat protein